MSGDYKKNNQLSAWRDRLAGIEQLGELGLWQYDPVADSLSWSHEALKILCVDHEDNVASSDKLLVRIHPDDREVVQQGRDALIQSQIPLDVEFRIVRPDGGFRYIHQRGSVDSGRQGQPTSCSGIIMDITERKNVEHALQQSISRYRKIYDASPLLLFAVTTDGHIHSVNEYALDQLGYDWEELNGVSVDRLQHPDDRELARQMAASLMRQPDQLQRYDIRLLRKDGTDFWVRKAARLIRTDAGEQLVLVVCEDVTEARKLSDELIYQATHDELTGLINRREFEKRLSYMLEAARNSTREHVLLYLDLDRFKYVNDTCGHMAGDELLRQIGNLLERKVRRRDTVARLGGDEFGVLIEHCNLGYGLAIAESIREEIEEFRFIWGDKNFSLGTSIGMVVIDAGSDNINELINAADKACYTAKDGGRNRVHVYQENDGELDRRRGEIQWLPRIKQSLAEDGFQLFCQRFMPVTADGDEIYIELLLRMQDDFGGFLLPNAFMPAAERYHLACSIDSWVIRTALRLLVQPAVRQKRIAMCSINLSAASLDSEDFQDFVKNEIRQSGFPPERLCFEISESVAIVRLNNARRFVTSLSELGCRFALDNFGSGPSSFAYLKNLAVNYLKIDGSLVRDMVSDDLDRVMVNSINEIGKVTGKKTIAGFVENSDTLDLLCQIGVDYVQGYAIGRPVPIGEVL